MSVEQEHSKAPGVRSVAFAGLLVFVLLCLLQLSVALYLNDGHFSFTLDDPYIHLALAQNLWQVGHYGVNLGEFSAPSSSVLWPFLIAPLSAMPWAILVLNLLFASATIWVMGRAVMRWSLPWAASKKHQFLRWVMVGLVLASNQVGLAFLGMEHSLQLLCVALLADGLLCAAQRRGLPIWIWPVFVLGPLVRYEMLALDAAVLGYAWTQRSGRGWSVLSACVTAGLLGAFSWWLRSMGLSAMPSSVKAKVAATPGAGPMDAIAQQLLRTLKYPQGIIMLVGVAALVWLGLRGMRRSRSPLGSLLPENKEPTGRSDPSKQSEDRSGEAPAFWTTQRSLGFAVVVACLSHACVGKYGWFYRYEVYVWTFFLLLGGQLVLSSSSPRFVQWLKRGTPRAAGMSVALGLAASSFLYLWALIIGPLGSNNIYEQQYQMHRLLQAHYPHPVAVNDLGWVAYRNQNYVLDLWGLGSEQARKARFEPQAGPAWMERMAKSKQVRLAMVYDAWFKSLPSSWTKIGTLSLGKMRITPAHKDVTFYLIDAKEAPRFCAAVKAWAQGLPTGVVFNSECR